MDPLSAPYKTKLLDFPAEPAETKGFVYLPPSLERDRSSVIDVAADKIFKYATQTVKNYNEGSFFSLKVATNISNAEIRALEENFQALPEELATKAKEHLAKILTAYLSAIKEKIPAIQFFKDRPQLYMEWTMICDRDNPNIKAWPPFTIEQSDCPAEIQNFTPSSRFCHDFAVYMQNASWAETSLFRDPQKNWPDELWTRPVEFLEERGFKLTETPQAGDLVVYYSTMRDRSKHFGIVGRNKKIISKFGMIPVVYEHPLADVTYAYGDRAYYFTKPIKTELQKEFLEETEQAINALTTFSHPATQMPVSPLGCATIMMAFCAAQEPSHVFPKSLYNMDYNEELKARMLEEIHEVVKGAEQLSKPQVLEKIKHIAQTIGDKIPLRWPY